MQNTHNIRYFFETVKDEEADGFNPKLVNIVLAQLLINYDNNTIGNWYSRIVVIIDDLEWSAHRG